MALVAIDQGVLFGNVHLDFYGKKYIRFHGIPYAQPPLGELRFKAPQEPHGWDGIRNGSYERDECYTRHRIYRDKMVGSEDCLYLNVYTHKLTDCNSILKPVMVWIHGGEFLYGSSKTDLYNPEYLLTGDIVLVTLNFRLGILGFLSLTDTSLGVPGNAGLKDIVMALRWVQKNIKFFYGDPNNVTLFGESTGGATVHYLMLSPMAKGLFHKIICQSGCALNPWAQGRNFSKELALILNINSTNEKKLLQKLRALSLKELYEVGSKVFNGLSTEEMLFPCYRPAYAPIVEKPSNEEAFLLEDPLHLLLNGKYNKVPLMAGFTNKEGLVLKLIANPNDIKFTKNFELTIPHFYQLPSGCRQSKIVADAIEQFYASKKLGPEDRRERYLMLQGDTYIVRDICKAVKIQASNSPYPVYLYRVSVESELNSFQKVVIPPEPGVAHGDDIPYLFKTISNPKIKPNSIEEISVKRFVKFWTNFAHFGDPNPKIKDPLININWKRITNSDLNCIDLGKELTVGIIPEIYRISFWDKVEMYINKQKDSELCQ